MSITIIEETNKIEKKYDVINEYPVSEIIDDEYRWVKDTLTDWNNEWLLTYDEDGVKLLKLVFEFYDYYLADYIKKRKLNKNDIILYFKGGNTMRLIANNFLKWMPKKATDLIVDGYSVYFKKSDNDFSIMVNPFLDDKIFDEINTLSVGILMKIRDHILGNLEMFNFFRLNEKQQKKAIAELRSKLSETEKVSKVNITQKPDISIRYETKARNKVKVSGSEESNIFYVSDNRALKFGDKVVKHFNLGRIKLAFNVKFPGESEFFSNGELIDVSIPHKDDSGFEHIKNSKEFYEHNLENIVRVNDEKYGFKFNTMTVDYVIQDLFKVLFGDPHYPWEDKKYEKRLARLIFFLFLDSFEYMKKIIINEKSTQKVNELFECLGKNPTRVFCCHTKYVAVFSQYVKKVVLKAKGKEVDKFLQIIEENCAKITRICENIEKSLSGYKFDENKLYGLGNEDHKNDKNFNVRTATYWTSY